MTEAETAKLSPSEEPSTVKRVREKPKQLKKRKNRCHSLLVIALNSHVVTLTPDHPRYPAALLSQPNAAPFRAGGALDILAIPATGFFCSSKCPGAIILRTFDAITSLRDRQQLIIGGFRSAQQPMFWVAVSMKTGNHQNSGFFNEEKQAIGEPMHAGSPPSFFQYRIMQRACCDFLHCVNYGLREALRKRRAYAFIAGERRFEFGVRLRHPDYRPRHCFLDRPALTSSHEITSAGFC